MTALSQDVTVVKFARMIIVSLTHATTTRIVTEGIAQLDFARRVCHVAANVQKMRSVYMTDRSVGQSHHHVLSPVQVIRFELRSIQTH